MTALRRGHLHAAAQQEAQANRRVYCPLCDSRGTDAFCLLPNRQCESLIIPAKVKVGGDSRRSPMSTLVDPSPNALTVCIHSVKLVSSLCHSNGSGVGIAFSFDRTPSVSPSRRSVAHALARVPLLACS